VASLRPGGALVVADPDGAALFLGVQSDAVVDLCGRGHVGEQLVQRRPLQADCDGLRAPSGGGPHSLNPM
jgi:hypothetical protein